MRRLSSPARCAASSSVHHSETGRRVLGDDRVGRRGREQVAEVGVLVRVLTASRGHRHDHDVDEPRHRGIGPRGQIVEAGLFDRLLTATSERRGLVRIAVTADLQPRLHPRVPAEQHAPRRWMHHQRRPGHVQRRAPRPRVRVVDEGADARDVAFLAGRARHVGAQRRRDVGHRGSRARPHPPPPGVRTRRTSPACSVTVHLSASRSARASSPPGSNQFSPDRARLTAREPPRPRRAPFGDERDGHGLEHLEVAFDAVAAREPRPHHRSRDGARSGGRASGTRARAPRPACPACSSSRCGRRSCPAADRDDRPARRRSSRSTPTSSRRSARCSWSPAMPRPPASGAASASAPRHTSATRWLTSTLPAPTATGGCAATIDPGRVITCTGRSAPPFAGIVGSVTERIANATALTVTASTALTVPGR